MSNKFKKEYFSEKWISTLPDCKNGYTRSCWVNLIRNASISRRYLHDILEEFDALIGETTHHLFKPTEYYCYKLNEDFDWEWYNARQL